MNVLKPSHASCCDHMPSLPVISSRWRQRQSKCSEVTATQKSWTRNFSSSILIICPFNAVLLNKYIYITRIFPFCLSPPWNLTETTQNVAQWCIWSPQARRHFLDQRWWLMLVDLLPEESSSTRKKNHPQSLLLVPFAELQVLKCCFSAKENLYFKQNMKPFHQSYNVSPSEIQWRSHKPG